MVGFEEVAKIERGWHESGEHEEPAELVEALLARYPFLAVRNRWSREAMGAEGGRQWTELQAMPRAWRKAVGIELVEDLRTVLLAIGGQHALETYFIAQIKEKFGSMRWYTDGPEGVDWRDWEYLHYVEEVYCSICGRICIYCGAMGRIRQTGGWILPICEREEGYESAHELEPLSHDGGFCVWICHDPDGTERSVSYKDLVVGEDALIVKELGLGKPLHVSDVWRRLCDAEAR